LIYNDRPQVGTLIKILVNQIPKNLCLRLTASAWEREFGSLLPGFQHYQVFNCWLDQRKHLG